MQRNILLSGEGGQGIQTIAKAFMLAFQDSKEFASYIPYFGVEQRGTPSIAYFRISDEEIRYPRFDEADVCVILQPRAMPMVKKYLTPNTTIIFDNSTVDANAIPKISGQKLAIPATQLASEKFSPKSLNVIVFGVLMHMLNLDPKIGEKAILGVLSKKISKPEVLESNRLAYQFGFEAVLKKNNFGSPTFKNKTEANISKSNDKTARIYPNLCKGCGICIEKCPVKALVFGEDLGVFATPIPEIDLKKCIACGNCKRFCPDGAIGVEKC